MLGVDLVGSRQIQPAHVGCAIGPDGSRRIQTVLSSLAAIQAWVQEENQQNLAMDRAYLAGQGAFPQRAAPNQPGTPTGDRDLAGRGAAELASRQGRHR